LNYQDGLNFILSHFEEPLWPRTISTKDTKNSQIKAFSKEEALDYFIKADLKDCRISAFGSYEQKHVIPNMIFVDLDNRKYLNKTIWIFHSIIDAKPTVLDTGKGYAILQPIMMNPWNKDKIVKYKGKQPEELSKLFLQWIERYLTNYKCDLGNHPSLKNTMIRIPGSYNTKLLDNGKSHNESRVKVVYGWDGIRAKVECVRSSFIKHVNRIIKEEQKRNKTDIQANPKNFQWIEQLLEHTLEDGRQRLLFDVSRYLINIKGCSIEESAEKIDSWLNSRYYSKLLTLGECKKALKDGKYPRRIGRIKNTDQELYEILSEEIKL